MAFVSHGARVGVRVSDASVLALIGERLPPGARPATSPVVDDLYSLVVGVDEPGSIVRRYNMLYVGSARLARSFDLGEVLTALQTDMEYTVAMGARRRLFVEAGVVAWRGRALILLGSSGSLPTSLIAALVRAGATYCASRYAVLDARGRVYPFPTTVSSTAGDDVTRALGHSFSDAIGRQPLPVGAIVVAEQRPGVRFSARPLSRGQGVLALLERAVAAADRPALALRVADAAAATASAVLRVRFDDASDAAMPLLAAADRGRHAHLGGASHATADSKRASDFAQRRG